MESGTAHYGVVPVENSTEGVINHTLDTFISSSLFICGEVMLRIHHHLLSQESVVESTLFLILNNLSIHSFFAKFLDYIQGLGLG